MNLYQLWQKWRSVYKIYYFIVIHITRHVKNMIDRLRFEIIPSLYLVFNSYYSKYGIGFKILLKICRYFNHSLYH